MMMPQMLQAESVTMNGNGTYNDGMRAYTISHRMKFIFAIIIQTL